MNRTKKVPLNIPVKRRNQQGVRSNQGPLVAPRVLQQVLEVTSNVFPTTGLGVLSQTVGIDPVSLLLAARLTGYRALADEVRIDLVSMTLDPIHGTSSSGRAVMYIERDPTAAIVGTVDLASDQRERVIGSVRDRLSLTWRPQEPTDREFNLLNPGTTSLGSFQVLCDNVYVQGTIAPNSTPIWTRVIRVALTIRGRP